MDSHKILSQAFNKVKFSSDSHILISYLDKSIFIFFGIYFNNLHVFFSHLNFIFVIYFSRLRYKKYIFREFSNTCLIIFAPLFYFKKKHIYFNVNHNFKNKNYFSKYKILTNSSFNFIFFDSSYIIDYKFINLNFPIYKYNPFKKINSNNKLRIGILGNLNNTYNLNNLNIFLSNYNKYNYSITIGVKDTNDYNLPDFNYNFNFFNTKSEINYLFFLDNIDILIFLADYNSYLYRHSGTIMDALSRRIIVFAPNYLVFKSQLTKPIQVGHLYNSIKDINSILSNKNNLFSFFNNFDNYLLERSSTQYINQ